MGDALVHIVNKEVLRQKRDLRAIGTDLDGSLTDLHKPEIYQLLWESILEFLSPDLRRQLESITLKKLMENGRMPVGWFLDMKLGYLVLTDMKGRIIKVREGIEYVSREKILKIYERGTVDISQSLNPDYDKPRFLPICDGFDYIEGFLKTMLPIEGRPRVRTIQQIDDAWYKAHHSPDGFKKYIMANPEAYGIKFNKQLKEFMERLKGVYLTFLLTSSPEAYTRRILDVLDLADCFDRVITDVKKPACFFDESKEKTFRLLKIASIETPQEVFYFGDHLYKDAKSAQQFGFFTGLRMKRMDINEVVRKLGKYASIEFETSGNMAVPRNEANAVQTSSLSNFLGQLYQHVHVLTTKIQNLEPLLLY